MIVFKTEADCIAAITQINNGLGLPSKKTSTWDYPHELKSGGFAIEKPADDYLNSLEYDELDINLKELVEYRLPDNFKIDATPLEFKVDNKYPVYSKTENYYEKTVTIVYLIDGEKKEVVEKMENVTVTKDGYSVDMADKIRLKEAESVKADVELAIDVKL